jgi:hypothetical protein
MKYTSSYQHEVALATPNIEENTDSFQTLLDAVLQRVQSTEKLSSLSTTNMGAKLKLHAT